MVREDHVAKDDPVDLFAFSVFLYTLWMLRNWFKGAIVRHLVMSEDIGQSSVSGHR